MLAVLANAGDGESDYKYTIEDTPAFDDGRQLRSYSRSSFSSRSSFYSFSYGSYTRYGSYGNYYSSHCYKTNTTNVDGQANSTKVCDARKIASIVFAVISVIVSLPIFWLREKCKRHSVD